MHERACTWMERACAWIACCEMRAALQDACCAMCCACEAPPTAAPHACALGLRLMPAPWACALGLCHLGPTPPWAYATLGLRLGPSPGVDGDGGLASHHRRWRGPLPLPHAGSLVGWSRCHLLQHGLRRAGTTHAAPPDGSRPCRPQQAGHDACGSPPPSSRISKRQPGCSLAPTRPPALSRPRVAAVSPFRAQYSTTHVVSCRAGSSCFSTASPPNGQTSRPTSARVERAWSWCMRAHRSSSRRCLAPFQPRLPPTFFRLHCGTRALHTARRHPPLPLPRPSPCTPPSARCKFSMVCCARVCMCVRACACV